MLVGPNSFPENRLGFTVFPRFKLRRVFLVTFLVISWGPLLAFGWNSYGRTVARELAEVEDQHLLLARNLSAALSRYERDLKATVGYVADAMQAGTLRGASRDLLDGLHIRNVFIVDAADGAILDSALPDRAPLPKAHIDSLLDQDIPLGMQFLPVVPSGSGPVICLVQHSAQHLVIAEIETDYFVEVGRQISFGVKGHAAIVDHAGNILFHPNPDWTAESRNISQLSPVQRMLAGETGIIEFYSPALEKAMISGFTAVPGPGWGVMIPQPLDEIYDKAYENTRPILFGLIFAAFAAAGLGWLAIRWLSLPMEEFVQDLENQSRTGIPPNPMARHRVTRIAELHNIFTAYDTLADTVRRNEASLSEQVQRDPITGIGNRVFFERAGEQMLTALSARDGQALVIFLDLDNFKEINDSRGHAGGDAFLHGFAQALNAEVARYSVEGVQGLAARIGGDEFAAILPVDAPSAPQDHTPSKSDRQTCESFVNNLPDSLALEDVDLLCHVSVGCAVFPADGRTIADLLRNADTALYASKQLGKGGFQMYDAAQHLTLMGDILPTIAQSVKDDEFLLAYQPKVAVEDHRVTALEALIRWRHPRYGLMEPDEFLPLVQKSRVMVDIDEWVLARAMRDARTLHARGHKLPVAVNIGVEHFTSWAFPAKLVEMAEAATFDLAFLEVEVTEEIFAKCPDRLQSAVTQVQDLGVAVAIDDFGKGYSSLSRFGLASVDVVKIDQRMIQGAATQTRFRQVIKSTIDMAHALGARVVLEGIETTKDLDSVSGLGADEYQGFHFAQAGDIDALVDWLDAQDSRNTDASAPG